MDAFVVEPGYTFKYYANVSQPEWEVWEVRVQSILQSIYPHTNVPKPEERPYLMIVQPFHDHGSGTITANTSFLCPAFEAERARLLGMPFAEPIQIIPWEEHWNPYSTLMESQVLSGHSRLMVDEEMRDFIQRGLSSAGFDVVGLGGHAEEVRQVKSEKEVGILRAVNTGTVEAVRQMRKCEFTPAQCSLIGIEYAEPCQVCIRACWKPKSQRSWTIHLELRAWSPFLILSCSVRFKGQYSFSQVLMPTDENAANPHGGTNGSKVLEPETFVLIDVGYGCYSPKSMGC